MLRNLKPDYDLWRDHSYEYEPDRTPIDVINGGPYLRTWVDDDQRSCSDLQDELDRAETRWHLERQPHLIYG